MRSPAQSFKRLEKRLNALDASPFPKMTSVVFAQLYLVWRMHRYATCRTLVSAIIELNDWHQKDRSHAKPADPAIAALGTRIDETFLNAAINLMERTLDTLEIARVDQYIEVMKSIVSSSIAVFGGDVFKRCLEVAEAIDKLHQVSGIPTRRLRTAHDEVLQLETTMQVMLTNAMLLEGLVGSITGRFINIEMTEPERIRAWKKPVIDRLTEFKESADEIFTETQLINFPQDGYWPARLR